MEENIEIIEVQKDQVPYFFTIDYKGKIFEIGLRYNAAHDFFTADLALLENDHKETLILGEKIMYGQMMFAHLHSQNKSIPKLLPWDFAGQATRVGFCELSDKVQLVVMQDDIVA